MNDFVRLLAAWALVHETADEGWKAAIARGHQRAPGELGQGPDAFVDGLAALVDGEKERLKAALSGEPGGHRAEGAGLAESLGALRFELTELRGRIESLQASVDAIAARGKD